MERFSGTRQEVEDMEQTAGFCILLPVYNEGEILPELLEKLEATLCKAASHLFHVIIIEDGSTDNTLEVAMRFKFSAPHIRLTVLNLPSNLGHQEAIYQGMLYAEKLNMEHIIIMDSDGEDNPEAVLEMIELRNNDIVLAVRGKRTENLGFRVGYFFYRLLFRLIIHQEMNFGNFCMISQPILKNLLLTSFVHFPAALLKQKVRIAKFKQDRGTRIGGSSKMNFQNLILHGLKSFTEYSEALVMLSLKIFLVVSLLFGFSIFYVLYQKLVSHRAILGWASILSVSLFNTVIVSIGFLVLGLFLLNISLRRGTGRKNAFYREMKSEINEVLLPKVRSQT